ncbi:MAG: histidine phosphatase family protein [Pseudomonadota bacterium]
MRMTYPDLLILRHGETEWNRAGRMQGALDSPLTPLGADQARRQRDILADFGVDGWDWHCSPQGRAHHTARIAGEGLADALVTDERLAEIGMGDWTGKSRADIMAAVPHLFELDEHLIWYDHAPGGEGIEALAGRTAAFLADLTGPSVIVTHGITSRILRCHALGLDPMAFGTLDGGQGVVYHLAEGQQTKLS